MDTSKGWIKLYRTLREHWLWSRPFSDGQAWIDLLLRANHAQRRIRAKSGFVTIERGQTLISTRNLAEEWGWSRGKVRRFIFRLKNDEMCSVNETSDGTIITLINYASGQDVEPADDTDNETAPGTNGGPLTVPKQELKNVIIKETVIPFGEIMECWNSNRGSMPAIREVDPKRQRAVKAHWKKHSSIDWFQDLFKTAVASDFLCGRIQEKPFVANFDFVMKNAVKILEGTYANRSAKPGYRPSEQDWTNNEL